MNGSFEKDQGTTEGVATPEWWDASRQEPVMDTAYLKFEIAFAHLLAEKLGKPFSDTAFWNTAFLATGMKLGFKVDGKSDEELLAALEAAAATATTYNTREYHPQGTTEFGCFHFDYERLNNAVRIHFHNRELDGTSPLADDKIERRKQELHDLFTLVKRRYPYVATVQGGSWLYSIPAYRRLFPKNYVNNMQASDASDVLTTGHGIYGQFLNHDQTFREDVARTFLDGVRTLEHPTEEQILALLPRQYREGEGPIEDFYQLYNVV